MIKALHESVLGEIKRFIDAIKKENDSRRVDKGKKNIDNSYYLNGSISNSTKNLIMTFPQMCDNSLKPETASMLNRANERNIVTMLQLLFSSLNLKGDNGAEVLSQIHKNINMNTSMDDIIDGIDNFVAQYESVSMETKQAIREAMFMLKEQVKLPQKSFPVDSLSERSLNDYTVFNINGRLNVRENVIKEDNNDLFNLTDDQINAMSPAEREEYITKLKLAQMRNSYNGDIASSVADKNATDQANNVLAYDKSLAVMQKRLVDTDVRKANEMTPTLMVIQLNTLDTDGKIWSQKPFVAGVKSRLIPVDSYDIIDRLIVKNKTRVSFLNLIRATTGEIGFVKDFLLCMDQAKIDAKNSAKKGQAARMWKVLENRGSKNQINKLKKNRNDASAITTLVINQETVNVLKKQFNFDLEKISNTRMILDAYNLLGIIIADESIEVAKFFYAGNDSYEQQAYSYLEKESNDNSYKKIINLLSKSNGR